VEVDGPKGTRDDTLLAGDTFLPVDVIDPVFRRNGAGRAVLHAFSHLALAADNRHSYDRVGIDHHHLDGTLLWVVHSKAFDGTDQFTNLASGTAFGHNGQFPRHIFLLALKRMTSVPMRGRVLSLAITFPQTSPEASTTE
jgi:hypothetical protein